MRTALLATFVFLSPLSALAGPGDPLSTVSAVPVGIGEKLNIFAAIDEVSVGTLTRFLPIAYASPKWKKVSIKAKPYAVDTKTPEAEAKMREKSDGARKATTAALKNKGVVEITPLSGAITKRFRISEWDAVVLLEKGQVTARSGEAGVTKQVPLGPPVAKLLPGGKCKGKLRAKLLYVAVRVPWKSVATYVEVICTPEGGRPVRRVRKLVVSDVSKLL